MSKKHRPPAWLDKAILDPSSVFSSPTQVAEDQSLTLDEKLRILRSWEYDLIEIAVSLEEGMPGPEEELLPSIVKTILRLSPRQVPL